MIVDCLTNNTMIFDDGSFEDNAMDFELSQFDVELIPPILRAEYFLLFIGLKVFTESFLNHQVAGGGFHCPVITPNT